MKISLTLIATSFSLIVCAGCTPGNNVPGATTAGTLAGGVIGSQLFHGSGQVPGIIGSAVVGGIVGDQVGQAMDRNDQAKYNYNAPHSWGNGYGYPPPRYYYGPPRRRVVYETYYY